MNRSRNNGFTLIELLVVVAVIAVLAALLLPALKAARDRAKTVECASNERQIGVGFGAFLTDHNGFYPYGCPPRMIEFNGTNWWPGYSNTRSWVRQIAPYLSPEDAYVNTSSAKLRRLMQCRANAWPFPNNGTASFGVLQGETPRSYQMNSTMFPLLMFIEGGPPAPNLSSPDNWLSRVNVNSIRNPAGLSLVGEIPWTDTTKNVYGERLPGYPGDPYYQTASFFWRSWTWQAITNANIYATWKRPDCSNQNAAFHNLGANILFVDGHVEWLSKKTLITYGEHYQATWNSPAGLPGNIFWTDNQWVKDGGVRSVSQFPAAPWPWDP